MASKRFEKAAATEIRAIPSHLVEDARARFYDFWCDWYLVSRSGAVACPNKVLGKPACGTTNARGRIRYSEDVGCPCRLAGWNDHPTLWRDDAGSYVFVAQPYVTKGVDSARHRDAVAMLREWCESNGLRLHEEPERSWHYPNWTTLLVIDKAPA